MKASRLLLLSMIFTFSCGKEDVESFEAPESILFIGNSYTYFNRGLAFHLKQYLSTDDKNSSVRVEEIAKGGYTLESHWKDTATVNAILRGSWDIIVLQEQSLRPVDDRGKMMTYAAKFDSLIKTSGQTKLYFFMTWAYKDQPDMIYPVSDSYNDVASKLKATVVPVGQAWSQFVSSKDTINLYDSDGAHPNINGTFYTASIFYRTMFHKDLSVNSYRDPLISSEKAADLKQSANKVEEIRY
ncbi:DUF4886 domain-containing protein [Chryseolinea sp. T2]|uniref:DUF4886 domain-containing protein n=1 Tax=Chryseolinea sp. T2 TaxID=3129255 RepID=UPI0030771EFF